MHISMVLLKDVWMLTTQEMFVNKQRMPVKEVKKWII
jgi:hypothetical protein